MERPKSILDRISIPTRIIVNRFELTAASLADVFARGELSPAGGDTCELEAGGQVVARGKIVWRGGRHFFKVLESAKEGAR